MDTRAKLTTPKKPAKMRTWQPQSRIADYIKGNVKLEDIVNKDKLVKPQDRHNKRAFLPPLNNDEVTSSGGRKQQTLMSRCTPQNDCRPSKVHSSATFTSSTRASSASVSHMHRSYHASVQTSTSGHAASSDQLRIQELGRAAAAKDDEISRLNATIERFRDCVNVARVFAADKGGDEDVVTVVGKLLECLVNVSTNIKNVDAGDERTAAFVNTVQHERRRWHAFATNLVEEVRTLRAANEGLRASIAEKDLRINEATAANARLCAQMATLENELRQARARQSQQGRQMIADQLELVRVENEKLRGNLREYERVYAMAAGELTVLAEVGDRVRDEFEAKRSALDEMNAKQREHITQLEKAIAELKTACQKLRDTDDDTSRERIVELEERHMADIRTLKEANEQYVARLQKEETALDEEVRRLKEELRTLQQMHDSLQMHLLELMNKNRLLEEEVDEARREKQLLEEALNEWQMKWTDADLVELNDNLISKLFAADQLYMRRLMQCLDDTIRCTGLLKEEDIR